MTDTHPMTPHEAGARALWQAEHPGVNASGWELLNEETRTAWVEKARPVVEAIQGATA